MITNAPSQNKTERHDVTQICLKVALNTINPNYIFKQRFG